MNGEFLMDDGDYGEISQLPLFGIGMGARDADAIADDAAAVELLYAVAMAVAMASYAMVRAGRECGGGGFCGHCGGDSISIGEGFLAGEKDDVAYYTDRRKILFGSFMACLHVAVKDPS